MKFLVDECLSQRLAVMARDKGYPNSSHVHWLGLGGIQDWNLIRRAVDEVWTLLTKNSYDFRGRAGTPGEPGLYASQPIHAGLVCLNGPPGMNLALQEELFDIALSEIAARGEDLVNQVLEVTADQTTIAIELYALPVP